MILRKGRSPLGAYQRSPLGVKGADATGILGAFANSFEIEVQIDRIEFGEYIHTPPSNPSGIWTVTTIPGSQITPVVFNTGLTSVLNKTFFSEYNRFGDHHEFLVRPILKRPGIPFDVAITDDVGYIGAGVETHLTGFIFPGWYIASGGGAYDSNNDSALTLEVETLSIDLVFDSGILGSNRFQSTWLDDDTRGACFMHAIGPSVLLWAWTWPEGAWDHRVGQIGSSPRVDTYGRFILRPLT